MKEIIFGWLIILFVFSAESAAQSGRNPNAQTTPTPPAAAAEEEEKSPGYSESTPGKFSGSNPSKPAVGGKQNANRQISQPAPDDVIKIETALITIPVSVFDPGGLYISNLAQENFKIFENGVEQEIAHFGSTEQPFTVVLLIDTSPSTEFKIEEIQNAAIAFVDQLKPQDKVMVVEFDENINVLAKPTNNRKKLHKAIRKADFGGGTSLYDAVHIALNKHLKKIEGRKAIVLFTDGVDTTSDDANFESTLYNAAESDVLIYPVYYNTFEENSRLSGTDPASPPRLGTTPEEYRRGMKYLIEIAEQTGGLAFAADSSKGLNAAFAGIAEELRRQYNIGYYPSEIGETGERKTVKVRVNRPNLIIRARGSYIVGAAGSN